MRKSVFSILIALFAISSIFSQSFAGKYNGVYQSEPVVLTLVASDGGAYSGVLDDSHNKYDVTARGQGGELTG